MLKFKLVLIGLAAVVASFFIAQIKIPARKPNVAESAEPKDSQDFSYPNARLIGQSGQTILLTSPDSVAKIIAWYKAKLEEKNMPQKTYLHTDTNGEIIDQLVGSGRQGDFKVEVVSTGEKSEILIIFRKKEEK